MVTRATLGHEPRPDQHPLARPAGGLRANPHGARPPGPHVYDLARDPDEAHKLATAEPELTAELSALLLAWAEADRREREGQAPTDAALRRTLKERGYWQHVSDGTAAPPTEGEPAR